MMVDIPRHLYKILGSSSTAPGAHPRWIIAGHLTLGRSHRETARDVVYIYTGSLARNIKSAVFRWQIWRPFESRVYYLAYGKYRSGSVMHPRFRKSKVFAFVVKRRKRDSSLAVQYFSRGPGSSCSSRHIGRTWRKWHNWNLWSTKIISSPKRNDTVWRLFLRVWVKISKCSKLVKFSLSPLTLMVAYHQV